MRVFGVSLEMPSDSRNYFGFQVDELSELVQTIKSLGSRHSNICDPTAGHDLPMIDLVTGSQKYSPNSGSFITNVS